MDAAIRNFLNNQSTFGVQAEGDPGTGWRELTFRIYAPPPLRLGVIAGDAIHNMRSALDNLVYELSAQRANTQFPIFVRSADYFARPANRQRSRRDSMLAGVPPAARSIIDGYQPFQRSVHPERDLLAILNRLSNLDKHRIVNATFAGMSSEPTFTMQPTDPKANVTGVDTRAVIESGHALEDGTVLCQFRTHPDTAAEVRLDGTLPLGIGFGRTADYIATTGTLHRMRDYVEEIIQRLSESS